MDALSTTSRASRIGIVDAIAAAALFGISTPLSKAVLGHVQPLMAAGLLYLGAGVGLTLYRLGRRALRPEAAPQESPLTRRDLPWFSLALILGGVAGPALLMLGLSRTPASTASLLLNLESVATAMLAWLAFREHVSRSLLLGMGLIVLGSVTLSWAGTPLWSGTWGPAAIVAACLCWGLDNNFTRKISGGDPIQIAAVRGLVAGAVNVSLALAWGESFPAAPAALACAGIGLLGYGVSLALFVLALRHVGTGRTSAYFSIAPFVGAAGSVLLLGEGVSIALIAAGTLMGIGLYLHFAERHAHRHRHEPIEHEHSHSHDEHHAHAHEPPIADEQVHAHPHRHEAVLHCHPHYPDLHHRHEHSTA